MAWSENSRGLWRTRGENPEAYPKAGPIFQQPFSLPINAQTLAEMPFRAVGKSGKNYPAASNFAGNPSSKEWMCSKRKRRKCHKTSPSNATTQILTITISLIVSAPNEPLAIQCHIVLQAEVIDQLKNRKAQKSTYTGVWGVLWYFQGIFPSPAVWGIQMLEWYFWPILGFDFPSFSAY